MIRWPRAAVSSSVQLGRMLGAKAFESTAFTYVPSITEGVLASAERGGYQGGPRPPKYPLQRLSTRQVYVVTRRPDAQLDSIRLTIAVPSSADSRILSAFLVGMS